MTNKILINAISSALQTIIVGIIYFLLYKFLLSAIGVTKLGLWSLIIASTSFINVANLGLNNGVVKFIAAKRARNDYNGIVEVMSISFFIVFVLMSIFGAILWFISAQILEKIVEKELLQEAISLLPFAIINLIASSISGIFIATLDGFEKFKQRAFITSITIIVYYILCLLLVPSKGLLGVAYAQLIQIIILIFLLFLFIHFYLLPPKTKFGFNFSKQIFTDLLKYGFNFQIISITAILFDPTVKFLLGIYTNLNVVAFYEMANRLVMQVRSVIVSAIQTIVPVVSRKYEIGDNDINNFYSKQFVTVLNLTTLLIIILFSITPLISTVWLKKYDKLFFTTNLILSFAWGVNIFSTIAYFMNTGTGKLKWNVITHILLVLIVLILIPVFHRFLSSYLIIAIIGFSISVNAILLLYFFHKENNIVFLKEIDSTDIKLYSFTVITLIGNLVYFICLIKLKYALVQDIVFLLVNVLIVIIIAIYNKKIKTLLLNLPILKKLNS